MPEPLPILDHPPGTCVDSLACADVCQAAAGGAWAPRPEVEPVL